MSQLVRLEGKHTYQNAHCAVVAHLTGGNLPPVKSAPSTSCVPPAAMAAVVVRLMDWGV